MEAYFLAESSLDQICKNIQTAENLKFSLSDMSGNGIKRAELYLRKVANVTLPFESDAWHTLHDFNKIRNILVHSGGIVNKGNTELRKISKRYAGLKLPEFDNYDLAVLGLEKEFNSFALEIIMTFFVSLHKSLNDLKK